MRVFRGPALRAHHIKVGQDPSEFSPYAPPLPTQQHPASQPKHTICPDYQPPPSSLILASSKVCMCLVVSALQTAQTPPVFTSWSLTNYTKRVQQLWGRSNVRNTNQHSHLVVRHFKAQTYNKGDFSSQGFPTVVPRHKLSMPLLFRSGLHVDCSSIHHTAGVWHQSPSPCQAKARARQTVAAVFMVPFIVAILDILGLVWGWVELQATQSAACLWWLFIQSECPTNGLPHVTMTSQTRTAVTTCLWKYWYTIYSPMCTNTNLQTRLDKLMMK